MAVPTSPEGGATAASADPEIVAFERYLTEVFAAYPTFGAMPLEDARALMRRLREPLVEGGPSMARTEDLSVPAGNGPVRLRLYVPTARRDAPALIYLHGGGWVFFSIDTHDRIMREYAARTGMVVLGVDYALSPEARFPVALEQAIAVARFTRDEASTLGVDGARIAIGGDSAGANLAMATALRLRDAGSGDLARALVLNYGVYDNDFDSPSYQRHGAPGCLLTREEMMYFWAQYVATDADRANPYARLTAARLEGLPPAYLAIAERDPLYDENRTMAARLAAAGVAVNARVYPGTTHSFLEAVSRAEVARRAFAEQAAWLRATLEWDG